MGTLEVIDIDIDEYSTRRSKFCDTYNNMKQQYTRQSMSHRRN